MHGRKKPSEFSLLMRERNALFAALKDMVNEYENSQKVEQDTLLMAKIVLLKAGADK